MGPDAPPRLPPRKQVLGTKVDAERDGVKVPTTLAEYCVKTKAPAPDEGSDLFFSPANVDASVMYRKWKESKGKDREYTDIIR